MKTELIMVGKTSDKHFQAGIDDYVRRVSHYMPFSVTVVPGLKSTRSLSEEQQRQLEGEQLLRLFQPSDCVVLLDERGAEMRSVELARWLEQKRQSSRRLVFVIGGPYGFSRAVYERSDEMLSLSRLTFSHQLVRLVFAEQLYRACTIVRGEPYHHE